MASVNYRQPAGIIDQLWSPIKGIHLTNSSPHSLFQSPLPSNGSIANSFLWTLNSVVHTEHCTQTEKPNLSTKLWWSCRGSGRLHLEWDFSYRYVIFTKPMRVRSLRRRRRNSSVTALVWPSQPPKIYRWPEEVLSNYSFTQFCPPRKIMWSVEWYNNDDDRIICTTDYCVPWDNMYYMGDRQRAIAAAHNNWSEFSASTM